MQFIVKMVVEHIRHIEMSEMEMIALSGLFLWRDRKYDRLVDICVCVATCRLDVKIFTLREHQI